MTVNQILSPVKKEKYDLAACIHRQYLTKNQPYSPIKKHMNDLLKIKQNLIINEKK